MKDLDTTPLDDGLDPPKQPTSLKEADKVSGPYVGDAESNDAPVRSNRPEKTIQRLAVGAGQHVPTDDKDIGPDGRLRPGLVAKASAKPSE